MNPERSFSRILLTGAAVFLSLALPGRAAVQKRVCERTVTANVVALPQVIYLNRLGAHIPNGMMFALARDVVQADATGKILQPLKTCYPDATQCTPGLVTLRPDKRPRPIVLRANEGDCLKIVFTNLLSPAPGPGASALAANARPAVDQAQELAGNALQRQRAEVEGRSRQEGVLKEPVQPTREANAEAGLQLQPPTTRSASIHVQGMPWVNGPTDDGSFVGGNPNSLAQPGEQKTYVLFAEHEGSYVLYSTADDWTNQNPGKGADGGTLAQGLFGSVNVQPSESDVKPYGKKWNSEWYRSQVTEQDLCLASKDKAYDVGTGLCTRQNPDALPAIDYQALYPDDATHFPLSRNLPILSMLCNDEAAAKRACQQNEIVHTDLTAIITGEHAGHFPSTILPAQQPPALRAISLLPDRLEPYR
ncbi:MAG TPA: hypothetical protein VF173_34880, partial [Thermoanaerobaculia bacterium]|nr:hypothetical protein [Thermoanaerobaculia bacterium]